jgi:hypothetical protein
MVGGRAGDQERAVRRVPRNVGSFRNTVKVVQKT